MSGHLPECDYERQDYRGNDNRICYCSRLRACEQRIKETTIGRHRDEWIADGYHHGYEVGYEAGRDAALTLAQEAVAAECPHDDPSEWCIYTAVIDALREESSGNPDNLPSAGKPDKTGELPQFTLDEYEDVKRRAYFAGLDAAQEAISKIPREDGGYCHVLHACDVEAAIDDLREKR